MSLGGQAPAVIEMVDSLRTLLSSSLIQALRLNPSTTPAAASEAIAARLRDTRFFDARSTELREFLDATAACLRRRGVLNPLWLQRTRGIGLYYFMMRAQPLWLQMLERQTSAAEQTTYHVLYGDWDALISLHGLRREADLLAERITVTTPVNLVLMAASRVLLFHGYRTLEPDPRAAADSADAATAEVLNRLVEDYDDPRHETERRHCEETGMLLGPVWQLVPQPATDITAYVGINARGPLHAVDPSELLERLLADGALQGRLVHFMELDQARPFQFLAKLVCRDFVELDQATDELSAHPVGRVSLETTTFVIARGVDRLPVVDGQRSPGIVTPDTRGIEALAQTTLSRLGSDAIAAFNLLDAPVQAMVLDSLYEIQDRLASAPWDAETRAGLDAAVRLFSDAALRGAPPGSLAGPVINVATVVEGGFKYTLERMVRHVYGDDLSRAQTELRLRTKRIGELTLGQILAALRTAGGSTAFAFLTDALETSWLDRLETFSDERNEWAHAGRRAAGPVRVEIASARHVITLGMDLLCWLFEEVLPAVAVHRPVDTRRRRHAAQPSLETGHPPTVFISHSMADGPVVDRIATALRDLRYPVWYAETDLPAGELIVSRVSDALADSDAMVVVLSQRSSRSRWVEFEVNAAMAAKLSGRDVTVVPVLIEDCEIPASLQSLNRIDMQGDLFEDGLGRLIDRLRQHRLGGS